MVTMTRVREAPQPVRREAPGGAQGRRELFARIEARKPEGSYKTEPGKGLFGADLRVYRPPANSNPRAPQDVSEWIDDRVAGALGSRTGLNEREFAYAVILEACRTGDPKKVRAAVREAAKVLPAGGSAVRVFGALAEFKGKTPNFALEVASAAVAEARALGWHKPPRQQSRRED